MLNFAHHLLQRLVVVLFGQLLEHYCAFLSCTTLMLSVLFYMIATCCQQLN